VDWKQFIASIIGSIAWPVVIFGILFIFRVQVKKLISEIRKITAGGVDLELSKEVEKAVSVGQEVEAEQSSVTAGTLSLDPALLELAKNFPGAAFLQAFKQLEATILKIRSRLTDRPHRTLNEVMHQLKLKGHISASVEELYLQLRKVRNSAAHREQEEMSSVEAVELMSQVKLLDDLLKNVLDQLPSPSSGV
jgi:argonaute-like protein implicated in RNA metabolism and viral defense